MTGLPSAQYTMIGPVGDPSIRHAGDVAQELGTDIRVGLTAREAAHRLENHGPNELLATAGAPAWRRALAQFQDPLVYLLMGAIVIALVAWAIEGQPGLPVDAMVIAAIVLINAVIGYVQQVKAEDAVAALARMTEETSSVLRGGVVMRVPSVGLVCGDILLLAEGDSVTADGRIFQCASLRVLEASLTGESEAVHKSATTLPESLPLADRTDMVFRGTAVAQGSARAIVTATGMNTQMGLIAHLMKSTAEKSTPLQQEVASTGRSLGVAVAVIAAVVVSTILLMSDIHGVADVIPVLLLGVALAVAAVPEGLPAILSVVLALGVQRMAGRHAIVRQLSSVETLGGASVICSDKTGTLTRSEMTLQRAITASGGVDIGGVGYVPQGRIEHRGAALADGPLRSELIALLSGGSLAGDASLRQPAPGRWEISGDPTDAAFLVAERKLGVAARRGRRFTRIGEIAFTSERKMMSTIELDHEHADEAVLISKGAPDSLLKLCNRVRVGMEVVALDDARREKILSGVDRLSDAALRTLAVAYRPLGRTGNLQATPALERDLIYAGTVGMMDPPREEAAVAIHQARQAGIRIIMITGDHPRTAARIAADLGIVEPGGTALTGLQIDALDEAALRTAVRSHSVYARVAPAHKLRIVHALQEDGNIVAMTGDGVNDAPALKAADIGVAMGISGTEVAKHAAKMVLADDNFATIVEAVREGRGILDNIRKFLRYLLSSNMGEVLTVFLGVVGASVIGLGGPGDAVVLPLLATQLLWVNLVTDSGPALAIGLDPFADDLMRRRPRRAGERLIDARMWIDVAATGLVIAGVTLLTIDLFLPGGLIAGTADLATARTAGFTVLVFTSLFTCLSARSETTSAFRNFFVNPWLWTAIAFSTLLQVAVVHLDFLNLAFGTVPLSPRQWLLCLAMGSIVLWFSELRKLAARTLSGRKPAAAAFPKLSP